MSPSSLPPSQRFEPNPFDEPSRPARNGASPATESIAVFARPAGAKGLFHAEDSLPAQRRQRLALGIGCDRGTPVATLARAVADALALLQADMSDIAAVASITLKADEPGLLALAAQQGWRIHFYTAPELAAVPVPNPSETVRKYTGTPSVSEAAALLAANAPMSALVIEKYKHQGPDGKNATVSLARFSVIPISIHHHPERI